MRWRRVLTWRSDRRFLPQYKRRVAKFPSDVRAAHPHSIRHRAEVLSSRSCGCFYCGAIFAPADILDWVDPPDEDEEEGQTALCPRCGIDSVIGDRAGFPITPEFLEKMNGYWF